MKTLKEIKQERWKFDIDFYLKLKVLAERLPADVGIRVLTERRAAMVARYGETVMKGI